MFSNYFLGDLVCAGNFFLQEIFWQFIKVKLNLPSRSWEGNPRKVLLQFSLRVSRTA